MQTAPTSSGTGWIRYPLDAHAEYQNERVRFVGLEFPLRGQEVETADLTEAIADVVLSNGSTKRVPFSAVTVPSFMTIPAFVTIAIWRGPDLDVERALVEAAGRRPEIAWGTRWENEPLTWRWQWTSRDRDHAEGIARRIRERLPDTDVSVNWEPRGAPNV